ncbi:MAG: phosphatidate cytidylyltransferase [Lentisphaerae bacterium]|nr:phosphatidate cytidylyltransferase [Lentisphaerota bacterium]
MFKYRLPSAIVLTSLILAGILLPGQWGKFIFAIVTVLLSYFAVYEFLDIISKAGKKSYPVFTSAFSAAAIGAAIFFNMIIPSVCIVILVIFVISCWLLILFSMQNREVLDKAINSVSGFFLVAFPLGFMVLLYLIGDKEGSREGRNLLLFLIAVTKSGDIGAYLVGMSSSKLMPGGNHKIIPSISPKKSWEGTIGGLVFSVAVAVLLSGMIPSSYHFTLNIAIFAGIILFIGGFAGDLAESALKRIAGVKDSGKIIPGIGGVLDLLDSLIINAPLFFLFLILFR